MLQVNPTEHPEDVGGGCSAAGLQVLDPPLLLLVPGHVPQGADPEHLPLAVHQLLQHLGVLTLVSGRGQISREVGESPPRGSVSCPDKDKRIVLSPVNFC